jgi:hypothetical protein
LAAIRSIGLSAALLLASCGAPKPLELPQQGPDRAATCGVVAAADARMKIDVKEPLPLETQGRILHYALLEASSGGEFDAESAGTVSRRMTELQEQVTGGKWQALGPACASAYPETRAKDVKLPAGQFEAQVACVEMAEFLTKALASQDVHYGDRLAAWNRMRRETNDALAAGLRSRTGEDLSAQQRLRRKALADAARLGPPVAVMEQCVKRFGSSPSRAKGAG